jgi:hypothetical protein
MLDSVKEIGYGAYHLGIRTIPVFGGNGDKAIL